jgi:hypothetical protein
MIHPYGTKWNVNMMHIGRTAYLNHHGVITAGDRTVHCLYSRHAIQDEQIFLWNSCTVLEIALSRNEHVYWGVYTTEYLLLHAN